MRRAAVEAEPTAIPRLPIAELRDAGYLQEANRRFFHPLGLALEVLAAEEPVYVLELTEEGRQALVSLADAAREAGLMKPAVLADLAERLRDLVPATEFLGGVWDFRDDPEGLCFEPSDEMRAKAERVRGELDARRAARVDALGYFVQPLLEGE